MVGLRNLCTPSYVYLVVSAIALVAMMYQNMGNINTYCIGSYTCNVSSTALIFVIKAIYILFWTWILNLICRSGHSGVAWFILLLPVILLFVILGGMVFYNNTKEGLVTTDPAKAVGSPVVSSRAVGSPVVSSKAPGMVMGGSAGKRPELIATHAMGAEQPKECRVLISEMQKKISDLDAITKQLSKTQNSPAAMK